MATNKSQPQLKKRLKSLLLYSLVLFLPVFYAYYNLWNTFFVADAWHMLNSYIQLKDYGFSYFFQLFAMPYGIHFLPIGVGLSTLQSYLFGMNVTGFGLLSLSLHFLNVLLVFFSVRRNTKNIVLALLAGLFFGVNYQIHEGVFWFASNLWTELSTSFVLIGLYFLIEYYREKRIKHFIISYLLFTASIFLREYSFMLFPLSIIFYLWLLLHDRSHVKRYIAFIGIYTFNIIAYLILRIFFVYAVNPVILTSQNISLQHLPYLIGWYVFTLPFKILANILIPEHAILFLTNFISKRIYFELPIAQTDVFLSVLFFDQLYIFFGFVIVTLIGFLVTLIIRRKNVDKTPVYLYGLGFVIIPYIFLTLSTYIYWTFSRYLYLPAAVFSVFFFSLLSYFRILQRKNVVSLVLLSVFLLYLALNGQMGHDYFVKFVKLGQQRKEILATLSEKLDFSKRDQIVYVKPVGEVYKNDIDVFDIGTSFGKVLLIWSWYHGNSKQIPPCLYDPMFLFNSNNQYKSCEGKGYGYFQDIDRLTQIVKSQTIDPQNLDAFDYDIKTGEIRDISSEIREIIYGPKK